jgi:hypothetical protein
VEQRAHTVQLPPDRLARPLAFGVLVAWIAAVGLAALQHERDRAAEGAGAPPPPQPPDGLRRGAGS